MAIAKTLTEFINNLCSQGVAGGIMDATEASQIKDNITGSTGLVQAINNDHTWMSNSFFDSYTPLSFDDCGYFFNYYSINDFLNSYNSNTIYVGVVNNNIILQKEDLKKLGDIVFYYGTTTGTTTINNKNSILGFKTYSESLEKWGESAGGYYLEATTTGLENLRIGAFIGWGDDYYSYKVNRPLFNNDISYGKVNKSIPLTGNVTNINVYAAMNSEGVYYENFYQIPDDLEQGKYHCFKIFKKAQFDAMLTLFGITTYYRNPTDLENKTNPVTPGDSGESGPDTSTEPNLTTNPGQGQNQVQNQQTGTGDWSSDEVTTPQSPYTGTGIGNCLYAINLKQMYKVRNELFRPDIISSFFIDNESLLGCTIWPFKYEGTGLYTTTTIKIGKYSVELLGQSETTPYAYAILPTYVPKVYAAQGIKILPKNGNFLDYAPYTKIKFYLPYIGIVDVDPCDIYDHIIDIYYLYEPSTGKGKGCIKSSSGVTYSWDCMLGTTVPFTISNMNQLMQNLALAGVKAAGVYATGGLGAVGEAYSATEVISSIAGSVRDFKISSTGGTGDSMGRLEPQEVYCITIGPYTRIPDDYNKNYGRPSLITVKLKDLKGFTTVPNPLFTTTATDTEKAEIVALLQGGVIING